MTNAEADAYVALGQKIIDNANAARGAQPDCAFLLAIYDTGHDTMEAAAAAAASRQPPCEWVTGPIDQLPDGNANNGG